MESLITELPEWARVLFYIALAVGRAGLFLYRRGQAASPSATSTTIRTMTADGEAMKILATSIEGLAFTMKELEAKMHGPARERRESAEETIEALKDHARELNELRYELRQIRNEMGTRHPSA